VHAAGLDRVLVQPLGDLLAGQAGGVHLEAALGLGLGGGQRGEQAVAQDAELEAVEDAVDLLAVPGAAGRIADGDRQRGGR
jgi:hypothetical protein